MGKSAVILAGGSGTRLWPLSRRGRPKQLLRIVEGKSLLRASFERLCGLFEPREIHVVVLAEHLGAVGAELPEVSAENLIGEPVGRDTANAVALAAAVLHRRDPETVMGVFTADHVIRPVEKFREVVRRGLELAGSNPDALVTMGVRPREPHTGLGYVQRGEPIGPGCFAVRSFKEKPDRATAQGYLDSGDYYWNSGMFAWRTGTILELLGRHLPAARKAAEEIAEDWPSDRARQRAAELYPGLERISIDYAVMEKAPRVLVVEMDLEWLDVGTWPSLAGIARRDAAGNAISAERVAMISAGDNIVVSEEDHLIAAIGVEGLVVVHSRDATLVCRREDVDRIRELVGQLEEEHGGRYT